MSNSESESFAWSIYWSADRLHSCVASSTDSDQKVLDDIWADFAADLSPDAKVLDLATGNGAVPVALLKAQPLLAITAVDRADIDPTNYVKDKPELTSVTFLGSTDVNKLDLDDEVFAAVTSQFGVEYAGLFDASLKALDFLNDQGKFAFIIHHADSELIASSAIRQAELSNLLISRGLIELLHQVLRGEAEFSALEDLGQRYASSDQPKTGAISGQVFAGIEQIAKLITSEPEQARKLGATLKLRLQAESDRLKQMLSSAQSEDQINEYCKNIENSGFKISHKEPIYVDDEKQTYLLAWLVKGNRCEQ